MTFIQLTMLDGNSVLVNADAINMIKISTEIVNGIKLQNTNQSDPYTIIVFNKDNSDTLEVREAPEVILKLITRGPHNQIY